MSSIAGDLSQACSPRAEAPGSGSPAACRFRLRRQQAFDLVQVGPQAREFLGNVDPDREARRFGERAFLRLAGTLVWALTPERLVPAFQEALAAGASPVQAAAVRPAHPGRAGAPGVPVSIATRRSPSRPRFAQAFDAAAPPRRAALVSRSGTRRCGTGAAPRPPSAAFGSQPCTVPSSRNQAVHLPAVGGGQWFCGLAVGGGAQLDLARAAARRPPVRAARFQATQVVGQAERKVQEAAVHRPRFDRDGWRRFALVRQPAGRGGGVPVML